MAVSMKMEQESFMKKSFELHKVGLCISRVLPFLGASPDSLVQ